MRSLGALRGMRRSGYNIEIAAGFARLPAPV
jgi:hypothetical protein